MGASNGTERVIQAVDRAIEILEYLAEKPNGERLSTICKDLQLNKSTTFGLIRTLELRDLVTQDEETGKYSLGVRLLHYGMAYQDNLNLVNVAQPLLDKLSATYGETVHMAVLAGKDTIYIAKAEAPKALRISTSVGASMPVYGSAVGKVLMANLPEYECKKLVDSLDFVSYTPNTIKNKEDLYTALEQTRKNGYAFDNGELEEGLVCVGAPIFNARNNCVAAVSVSLPNGRSAQFPMEAIIQSVIDTANGISAIMGRVR